jgi:hypothetical protein
MNLNDIAANFKNFPLVDPDSYDGDCLVEDMMESLFADVVRPRSEQYVPDLLEKSRISLYAAIGTYYGGMHILVIDDKPVAVLMKALGDREDSQRAYVVDAEVFASVATEMAVAETKKRIASVDVAGDTPICKVHSPYLHFLGAQSTMFAIGKPVEVHRFSDILKGRRGYTVDSTGAVFELQSIGAFEDDEMVKVTLVGGQEQLVEACELMFELVSGQGNIEDALTAYAADPHWVLQNAFRNSLNVFVLMQRPYCWSSTLLAIELDSLEEFDRFCAAYPEGKKDEHLQRGVFSLEELGYKGRSVC